MTEVKLDNAQNINKFLDDPKNFTTDCDIDSFMTILNYVALPNNDRHEINYSFLYNAFIQCHTRDNKVKVPLPANIIKFINQMSGEANVVIKKEEEEKIKTGTNISADVEKQIIQVNNIINELEILKNDKKFAKVNKNKFNDKLVQDYNNFYTNYKTNTQEYINNLCILLNYLSSNMKQTIVGSLNEYNTDNNINDSIISLSDDKNIICKFKGGSSSYTKIAQYISPATFQKLSTIHKKYMTGGRSEKDKIQYLNNLKLAIQNRSTKYNKISHIDLYNQIKDIM